MSPILGIIASSKAVSNSYESIATVTVGSGGSSSITFSSIPSTYQHLQIRAIGRTNRSANGDYSLIAFNSDTSSSNYTTHYLSGNGSTVDAGAYVNSFGGALVNRWGAANDTSNTFGALVLDILDYANTNKYKTVRSLGGLETNTSNSQINLQSALWLNTAAISNITITPGAGTSFNQYSSFALYGIKG